MAILVVVTSRGFIGKSLSVTELVALPVGAFRSDAVVAEDIGLLCRHAPLWGWYIRLPGPMHLGKSRLTILTLKRREAHLPDVRMEYICTPAYGHRHIRANAVSKATGFDGSA